MSKYLLALLLFATAIALVSCVPSTDESLQQDAAVSATSQETPTLQPDRPLEELLNEASLAVVLRFPETITHLGIGDLIGVRDDALTPVSRAYELETMALLESLLEELDRYDLSTVDPSDALSARVYGWYLEDLLESHRFSAHDYPINSHISSYPTVIEHFLARVHPMQTLTNAEDYISRLQQLSTEFDGMIARLDESEQIGAMPPAFILRKAAESILDTAETPVSEMVLYATFVNKLGSIPTIPDPTKRALEGEAVDIVQSSVIPAYLRLAEYVSSLAERAGDEIGVWRHDDGAEYYAHRLRKYTTTNLSADEIYDLGLAEVDRIQAEILEATEGVGLNVQADLQSLFEQVTEISGVVSGRQTVEACQQLINGITELVRPVFLNWPDADILVVEGQMSAFFSPGSLDGSRPGMFYAPAAREEPLFSLPTLTYHEAIPGHGLQTAFAYAADIPVYRAGLGFTAYAEGWALYAERLAWEMGAYEDDAYGNLGRLQAELFRAARLVVDTGIHAKQWTYDQAVDYLRENTGLDEEFVRQEIERYIVLPGQATAYKIGMLKMLELRDRAQRELGDAFDLATFHQAILEEGDVPLLILEELVDAYIERSR